MPPDVAHNLIFFLGLSYQKLRKSLVQLLEKIIELKRVPRGFLLKFHSNSNNTSYKFILENCFRKLIISTVGVYQKFLPPLKIRLDKINTIIIADKWKENYHQMNK